MQRHYGDCRALHIVATVEQATIMYLRMSMNTAISAQLLPRHTRPHFVFFSSTPLYKRILPERDLIVPRPLILGTISTIGQLRLTCH